MAKKEKDPSAAQVHPSFDEFVATIAALRAPGGCPWDREQTHRSIAHNMIEEAYEAVDAIEAGSVGHLREELGDVLLQVVLQSQIAADEGSFTIDDVCHDINAKMIRRHPHVFGDAAAENAGEVLDLWDQVKLAERAQGSEASLGADAGANAANADGLGAASAEAAGAAVAGGAPEGLLDGVPTSFPALMQAQKVSRKAAAAGFEWETVDDVWEKVHEEIGELRAAYFRARTSSDGKVLKDGGEEAARAVELEFGDVLFSLVNVARRMGIDAEGSLREACAKFRNRWAFMEGAAWGQGRRIEDLPMAEQEELWQIAKAQEQEARADVRPPLAVSPAAQEDRA